VHEGLDCSVPDPDYGLACLLCLLEEPQYYAEEVLPAVFESGVKHGHRNRSLKNWTETGPVVRYIYTAGVQSGQNERNFVHLATRWALDQWLLADLVQLVLQHDT